MLSSEERYARRLNQLLRRAPETAVARDAARILRSLRGMTFETAAATWGFPDPKARSLGDALRCTNEVSYRWGIDVLTFGRVASGAMAGTGAISGAGCALAAMYYDPDSRQLLRLPFDTVVLLAGCDHPLAGMYLPAIRARDAGYVSFSPI